MIKQLFEFEEPHESPGFLLWQTTITWQRLIKKALDFYKISHAQFVILVITFWFENNKEVVSQSLIIRQSKLDKMTVSKSLKKLVAQGFAKRLEHKEDTRAKSVFLTKKGRELTTKLIPIIEKIDKDFFGILKNSERLSLINNLHYIVSKVVIDE